MSTKTIYKRIALVAVTALGAGVLSVAPASATDQQSASGTVSSINLKAATANTLTVDSSQVVFVGSTQVAESAAGAGNNILLTYKAYLSAYPAGGFVGVVADKDTAGSTITGQSAITESGATLTVKGGTNAAITAETITATGTTGLGNFGFTPTVAGAYTVTVWNDQDNDGVVDITEAVQTVSMTVAAAAAWSSALSTAHISVNAEGANTVPNSTTDKSAVIAARAVGTKAGTIFVTLRDSANALYTGQTVTATVTGSGFVSVGSSAGATGANIDTADGTATTTRTANAVSSTGYAAVGIWGDGTSGTGTITVSVTDKVTLATTVLATKTVSWYGTVATLTATVLQGIATPGTANGDNSQNAATQATLALTPAVVVVAKDANGVVVPGLTVTGKSADVTIVASSTTAGAVNGTTDKNGPGYYNFAVTGGAAANVGKSTTIVYSTIVNAALTISSAPVTISLGGTPATVTMTLDKTSYTPGEKVTITVNAKDAAGNNAADGTYANLFAGASVLGGSFTGSTPAASVELVGGKATYTAFAPGSSGTYSVSNKLGTSLPAAVQGNAVTASVVVGASADMQAITTLINSLVAKINALNKLVIKIQKKVRA